MLRCMSPVVARSCPEGMRRYVIHLVAIPISNASVNPARSTATAIFGGGIALSCVWLFWVAPIVGGVIGGLIARWLQTAPAGE
jgi:aquaporin Z